MGKVKKIFWGFLYGYLFLAGVSHIILAGGDYGELSWGFILATTGLVGLVFYVFDA